MDQDRRDYRERLYNYHEYHPGSEVILTKAGILTPIAARDEKCYRKLGTMMQSHIQVIVVAQPFLCSAFSYSSRQVGRGIVE